MQMPAAQNNLRTKHLDLWVNADSAWMDMAAWDRAADKTLTLADFDGETCVIGLDLATKIDIAAKIRIFTRDIDGTAHYYVFGQYYLPQAAVSDGRNAQYPGWEIAGLLTVTPGDVLDFETVVQRVGNCLRSLAGDATCTAIAGAGRFCGRVSEHGG